MTPLRRQWWRPYVGGRYLWKGRSLDAGVDCWGLCVIVLPREFARTIDDFGWAYSEDYAAGRADARARIAAELPAWRKVPWEEGALALFTRAHVGICTLTPGVVLHAHQSTGVDLLNFEEATRWQGRFLGCYLPPDPA